MSIAADIKKTRWTEEMKLLAENFSPVDESPENIESRLLLLVVVLIKRKARPMLIVFPTFVSVVLIPEARPRLYPGTELIMDDRLGEAKMPIPDPISASGKISCNSETPYAIRVIRRNPMDDRISPATTKNLGPNLSERTPLIGPIIDKEIDIGTSKSPA